MEFTVYIIGTVIQQLPKSSGHTRQAYSHLVLASGNGSNFQAFVMPLPAVKYLIEHYPLHREPGEGVCCQKAEQSGILVGLISHGSQSPRLIRESCSERRIPAVFPGLTLSCWLVGVYLWRALIAPRNGQGEGHGFMSMRVSLRAGSRVGKGASASNEISRFQTFDRQGIGARMWALDVKGDMSSTSRPGRYYRRCNQETSDQRRSGPNRVVTNMPRDWRRSG